MLDLDDAISADSIMEITHADCPGVIIQILPNFSYPMHGADSNH